MPLFSSNSSFSSHFENGFMWQAIKILSSATPLITHDGIISNKENLYFACIFLVFSLSCLSFGFFKINSSIFTLLRKFGLRYIKFFPLFSSLLLVANKYLKDKSMLVYLGYFYFYFLLKLNSIYFDYRAFL